MAETPATRRWRKIIAAHDASGMTIKAFAQAHQLKSGTLAWWRSELKRRDAMPEFTELVLTKPATPLALTLDDFRAHLVIDQDTDLDLLRRVLQAIA